LDKAVKPGAGAVIDLGSNSGGADAEDREFTAY
jgi:hypothetical protein